MDERNFEIQGFAPEARSTALPSRDRELSGEHAMERAVFNGRIYGKHPVVMNFIFDDDAATADGLKILDFGNGGQEWAEFVFNNNT